MERFWWILALGLGGCGAFARDCEQSDGEIVAHGESVSDGCNTCTCDDGALACTQQACVEDSGE